ncbi:S-layer homology domain-containing protein [Aneurinibacillus migulanus]|uniref:S-layer homology domain-containing protein n=1 Tax=Aneurinibacillus migulanus TaxID=47500 RepID=UPI002E1C821A|nr:S-layer homology domain-containing protein [Aneurinibacillus migulanus]
MNKKIVAVTLATGLFATGVAIPQMVKPVFAVSEPTVEEALKFFQPNVTKEMREFGKKMVEQAKPDMDKLKQGTLEVKLPEVKGKNYIYVTLNGKSLHNQHGGITVNSKVKKGELNYIDISVEDIDLGALYGLSYIWDDAKGKLTAETFDKAQVEMYKEVQKEQKQIEEQLKQEQKEEAVQTGNLSDISNHWAKDQIIEAVKKGLVGGYPDGTFRPNNSISRAEFITILTKALGYEKSEKKPVFKDVSGWAAGSIAAALDKGLLKQSDAANNQYHPNSAITRNEIAVLTVRALGMEQKALSIANPSAPFKDTKALDKNWVRYIQVASNEGILKGDPDGTFRGNGYTTRAEAVSVIFGITNKLGK